MIEDNLPVTWEDLQSSVNQIFIEIGLKSEVGRVLETPRGKVEIDVYAIDINSIDKIQYIVECKNWSVAVPQSVIHSFTTVMQETGGNIGYIISQKGFQSGAQKYTKNTNIKLFTFEEFQKHYFKSWYVEYFAPQLGICAENLILYTEPINSKRTLCLNEMSIEKQKQFKKTYNHYFNFGAMIFFFSNPKIFKQVTGMENAPDDLIMLKDELSKACPSLSLKSTGFRGLINELNEAALCATNEFDLIFGKKIFLS